VQSPTRPPRRWRYAPRVRHCLLLLTLLGCGDDATPILDAGRDAGTRLRFDSGPVELEPAFDAPAYAEVGESLILDASASRGATEYEWFLGDGRSFGPFRTPRFEARWDAPGRYQVVLTVRGAGPERTVARVVTVVAPAAHAPSQSSTLAAFGSSVAAVSADTDELVVFDAVAPFEVRARIDTPAAPRTVTPWAVGGRTWLAVPCQDAAVLLLVTPDGGERFELPMPERSRPFGAAAVSSGAGDALYVSLQATGRLAEVIFDEGAPLLSRVLVAVPDARGVAATPDGRVAVSRWRSTDVRGDVVILDPETGTTSRLALRFDPQASTDTESGGVPSYLEQILFSPSGELAIPSLQANIGEGLFRSELDLTFETTVRAIVSFAELRGGSYEERFEDRKQFDNRGFASAGVWTSRGDYLFVAMRGSRAVHRLDAFGRSESGTLLGTGYAPDGLALSPDDQVLFVSTPLSRRVDAYDVSDFRSLPTVLAQIPTTTREPLSPEVLRGKQLFNDSADPRLARDSYIACAHCHLEGDSDHRVWDFTDRGEGLRRTPPLFGRTQSGLLHWSGNFDEVQDFEHDLRGPFDGSGLLSEEDWLETNETLGEPKAGRSDDLDALAAYVLSLTETLPSPHLDEEAAARGRAVFESAGCTSCHAGDALSDSGLDGEGAPILHDVGTLRDSSGDRLGEPLTGLDTPTLRGLWHQPRYLHDGSADSLEAVLTTRNEGDAHGTTSPLSDAEIEDLVAYLRAL